MPNLTAIATPATRLFGGGQNETLPRTAALCAAAAIAAIALALPACAQPMPLPATPSPAPLPPTAAPSPTSLAIPTPTPLPPAPTPLPPTPTPAPARAETIPIPDNVAFTQITAGKTHACGLRENGAIDCWGSDPENFGSLDAPDETDFTQISAGLHLACGLRQDATIHCWGDNSLGQASPPQGAFSKIAVGRFHACALPLPQAAPPKLICWGNHFPNGPETLPLDAPISDMQSGAEFTCWLTPQADMTCLSIEPRSTEITPGPFTRLGVGLNHVCALREDGSAFCQGQNYQNQSTPPPTEFVQIAAGWFHSCGITRESRIECWGSGRAGSPGERLTAPAGEFAAIAIGWRNSCALRPNGRAVCWQTPDHLPIPNRLPYGVSEAFGGAAFESPVDIFPWQNGGLAIVHRHGVIAVHHDQPGAPPPQTILDITHEVFCCPGETGMLSATLDPQFQDFPFLYVWYRTLVHNPLDDETPNYVGRLARFRVERRAALKNSELPILDIPLPNHWHLGGAVRFGADGMLYLGIGDNSPQRSPQDLDNLEGKIIRIDVRGAHANRPYRVPPDNPFVDKPGARPEIWAYGLRNPWRMAFDPANPARLFVADVGLRTYEEVSIATAAANLGWPLCEGSACRDNVDAADLAPPLVAYGRDVGCAVIGGITVPWLDDGFIFSDLCARRVWLLEQDNAPDSAQPWRMREIADLSDAARSVLAFGAGDDGSVYVLTFDGPILRLDPSLADNLPDAPPDE